MNHKKSYTFDSLTESADQHNKGSRKGIKENQGTHSQAVQKNASTKKGRSTARPFDETILYSNSTEKGKGLTATARLCDSLLRRPKGGERESSFERGDLFSRWGILHPEPSLGHKKEKKPWKASSGLQTV